ncbi:MAG TPA: hypothetical protein VGM05_16895 [Planctomycetaceae bacterium]
MKTFSELHAAIILIVAGIYFVRNLGAPWWIGMIAGLGIYGVTIILRLLVRPFRQ